MPGRGPRETGPRGGMRRRPGTHTSQPGLEGDLRALSPQWWEHRKLREDRDGEFRGRSETYLAPL